MKTINTMTRPELEVLILENDLEDTLFGGIKNIMSMTDEQIKEKLIKWVIEGNETK